MRGNLSESRSLSTAVAVASARQRPAGAIRKPTQRSDACFATMLGAATGVAMPKAPGGTARPTATPAVAQPGAAPLGAMIGRSVGSGQCVALVQASQPSVGRTAGWSRGAAVMGNAALAPGTPIATFSTAGRYTNATDGSSHAAIYLGQTAQGMQVLDQWQGSAAAVRTIPWVNPGAPAANTGSAFRVIQAGQTRQA